MQTMYCHIMPPTHDFPWSMGEMYVTSLRTEMPESLYTSRSSTLNLCSLNKWYTYSLYFPSCIFIMLIWLCMTYQSPAYKLSNHYISWSLPWKLYKTGITLTNTWMRSQRVAIIIVCSQHYTLSTFRLLPIHFWTPWGIQGGGGEVACTPLLP